MYKDDRYNDKCLMIRGYFVEKSIGKQVYVNFILVLIRINFKMDFDSQLKLFQIIYKEYYLVRFFDEVRNFIVIGKSDWMRSYIL